jgi:hypothetical protein
MVRKCDVLHARCAQFSLLILTATNVGCGGKSSGSSENTAAGASDAGATAIGLHDLVGTCVVRALDGALANVAAVQPPKYVEETLAIASGGAVGTVTVRLVKDGCTFDAKVDDSGVVTADNVDCALDPKGSLVLVAGTTQQTILNYRFDSKTGIEQFSVHALTAGNGQTVQSTSAFCERHAEAVAGLDVNWVEYNAMSNYPVEIPDGSTCTQFAGSATDSGYVSLSLDASGKELAVRMEGLGCTLTANSTDGTSFAADDVDCAFDPRMSVAQLGIVSCHFDLFSLDIQRKRLAYNSKFTRKRDSGELVDFCLKLDSSLVGDFP